MALEVEDTSGTGLKFLKDYAVEIGADLFVNQYDDRLTFSFQQNEESLWWGGDAVFQENSYMLNVVKQTQIL